MCYKSSVIPSCNGKVLQNVVQSLKVLQNRLQYFKGSATSIIKYQNSTISIVILDKYCNKYCHFSKSIVNSRK